MTVVEWEGVDVGGGGAAGGGGGADAGGGSGGVVRGVWGGGEMEFLGRL